MDGILVSKVNEWIMWDKNMETRSQISKLYEEMNINCLKKLLLKRMEFGTAGLRARMGPGFSQMNDLTIIQTGQGLLKYINANAETRERGIIVGFDARHNSRKWAKYTANIFIHAGFKVYLFRDFCPTPYLAFGVRHFETACGIMVTASHNPKYDNGYKVYWSNGVQILSPHDKGISSCILECQEPSEHSWAIKDIETHPLCLDPMPSIEEAYLAAQMDSICFTRSKNKDSSIKFVYTAMHGVGWKPVERIFNEFNFISLIPVTEQIIPDPEFPTVDFPNPEEGKSALKLAMMTADKVGSPIILANDPDADRLGVAEKQVDGSWKILNGNELGSLYGWWIWTKWRENNPDADLSKVYMLSSVVSSKILKSIADIEGFKFEHTLTGFKWIANKACEIIRNTPGAHILFAFEEAIGFMCGSAVLDKDGVSAMAVMCELATYLYSTGRTLEMQLAAIYEIYGKHVTKNGYYFCHEPPVILKMFNRLRNWSGTTCYPSRCGRFNIIGVRDLTVGHDDAYPDKIARLPTSSSSQMITFRFHNGVILTLRTSGTEPKIKFYSELSTDPSDKRTVGELNVELSELIDVMIEEFYQPILNGFTPQAS